MPQSGLWRKKLLAIKFCAAAARCLPIQDFRLPPTSENRGGAESLTFPRLSGFASPMVARTRWRAFVRHRRPSVRPRRRAKAGAWCGRSRPESEVRV